MEALMEREEGQVENWNDDRLDELSRRMDAGFKETRGEMREGFDRFERVMSEGFAEVNQRIDRLMLTLLAGTLAMIGTLLGVAVF